ncbi:hypothetical protein L596_002372 [Steinernema carpocapsae]|uniref:Secreted protein n=1 Tax=Steinernema carpocapsae TaxID=34508 RepID=A0A4U8UQX1_STECR|nr:hypothetical protein L596_002372 [Steinernema carpocapsae]
MPGATAVVTIVALQMDLSLANISATGKAHRATPFPQSVKAERTAYLHNQRARIQRGHQYFSCNNMDLVASRRSNVSKEASNPSQKAMRKDSTASGLRTPTASWDATTESKSQHVSENTSSTYVRKVIQITSTLILPITRAGFNKF